MSKFTWEEAENLKKECARSLRKAGHKSGQHSPSRKRKKFAKPDDTKLRIIKGVNYVEWMENHGKEIEPCEANPDLWEDDLHNTVD